MRRLALFLEKPVPRHAVVVFEPNDEPLWAPGATQHRRLREGCSARAFQARRRARPYFVKCDSETTTQADINLGVLNVIVGFAPPAGGVRGHQDQQMAGQIQA